MQNTQDTQNEAIVNIYGADWCGDCKRAKAALERFGVSYAWHDIEHEDGAEARAIEISGQKHIPVVLFSDETFLVEPSANDLKTKLTELGVPIKD
ncbi:glutaredoxin domain-containing protein [Bifidobacterium bombi]|uniref:Glutaredoxin n=1 Tax=Bifidobacterium bombi DSM 19703 TaxID=1341695 RepID=A0A080N3T1_9BIFI|nr:glutaredoxin domain-containing protein [Bifidobacterium bombi]KFF30790.1 glutaredoxin [Bifidobacterium bombi DSM 19703]